jgi:hypothetical protein
MFTSLADFQQLGSYQGTDGVTAHGAAGHAVRSRQRAAPILSRRRLVQTPWALQLDVDALARESGSQTGESDDPR